MTTYFSKCDPKFLPVPEDNKVESGPFIEAAKNIPQFFDLFGTAFKPVKSDLSGNVAKLSKVHTKDPEKFKTLYSMLEDDIANKTAKNGDSATVALVWLTRGLEYMLILLKELISSKKSGEVTEDIRPFVTKAYEQALKKYHGWIIQKVFSVVSHAAPYRKDLIKAIALGEESQEEQVYSDMEAFVKDLGSQIDSIKNSMAELNIDSEIKA